MLFCVHNSFFYYIYDLTSVVNDYYNTIVELIKTVLTNNPDLNINILFGNDHFKFNNSNKTLYIQINYEHILVKQGGRSSHGAPIGKMSDEHGNFYLVRIDRYNELNKADIIIDYSVPNIHHVASSNLFNDFSKKHIYIYSSIYADTYFSKENRHISTLTTFINTGEPRRKKLIENIKREREHMNINNCFEKDALHNLYKNTKIMINIHQTNEHDTFEELRVLPALQCGVIVISENSALNELIPYNDYIIWSSYADIIEKTRDVINNYDSYHDSIFKNKKNKKLNELNSINYQTLEQHIKNGIRTI